MEAISFIKKSKPTKTCGYLIFYGVIRKIKGKKNSKIKIFTFAKAK
jgi:hypothetical protein